MSGQDIMNILAMYESDKAEARRAFASPCAEYMRFCAMVDEAGIDWWDMSELGGEFPMHRMRGHGWSVVYGRGSYGALEGRLEFMALASPEQVEGWLTAEQAFELVKAVTDAQDRPRD